MLYKIDAKNKSSLSLANDIKNALNFKSNKVIYVYNSVDDHDFWISCSQSVGKMMPMQEDYTGNKNGMLLTDIKYPWHEESSSFSHSNTRQPLHTDASYESDSPDLTFFYCKKKSIFGGATIFVDLDKLKNYISYYSSSLLNDLMSCPVKHFKGNDSKYRPIIHSDDTINWNYFRCEDCPIKFAFHDFLEKYIIHGNLFDQVILNEGEALFFKDSQLLHGRTSFIGDRWLVKGGICLM